MKDNFSVQSDAYAKFRPSYPIAFFDYLNSLLDTKEKAWDCGTGNGQVAIQLAKTFQQVCATDISQAQLDNAFQADNIHYSIQPSEKTNFKNDCFDLIIVAQAIHWFDFDKFYEEVKRTAKKDALFCVIGYDRIQISEPIDTIITNFYTRIIGPYWDSERKYIDEAYQTIPFPFEEMPTPEFENNYQWSLDHVIGYLNTWSAVKHFTKQNGFNPVENLQAELQKVWNEDEIKEVRFPLLLRIGKI